MVEEKKQEKSESNSFNFDKFVENARKNPWMTATIVLAIVCLVFLYFIIRGGASVSPTAGGTKLVAFLNAQTGGGVSLVSTKDIGNLYEISVSYQSQTIPVYITKDGKYFIQQAIPLTTDTSNTNQSTTPKEVPKSDKPTADLYVFSYCPYGTQTEKGFLPVYNILKNKADLNIRFIGAMHGQYEQTETYRQLCIQKLYGKDKLFAYIDKFISNAAIGTCGSNEACSKPLVEGLMPGLGIIAANVNSCMVSNAKALYDAEVANAETLGISGSPTFVVNGVETSSGRSPSAMLTTICSAFNTAPAECSQVLSSDTPAAGFGGTASASAGSAASC